MALLFSQNREAVKRFDMVHAQMTLCLFDDDTSPRWLRGAQAQACFDGHQNINEEVEIAIARQTADSPVDARRAKALRQVCAERSRRASATQPYGPCAAATMPP